MTETYLINTFKYNEEDLDPIYTIANTQRIRIYSGKLEFSLDKILSDSKRLHCKGTKDNQTLVTFVTSGNLSGLLYLHERKYGALVQLCCEFTRVKAFTP